MGSSRPSSAAAAQARRGEALGRLVAAHLPPFLSGQRWFPSKGRRVESVALVDWGALPEAPREAWLTLVEVRFDRGPAETYAVPLAARAAEATAARVVGLLEEEGTAVAVGDAFDDREFCLALLGRFGRDDGLPMARGAVRFSRTGALVTGPLPEGAPVRRIAAEQSNTSIVYADTLILKAFRKVEAGVNPDGEVTGFLTTRTRFRNVPLLGGTIEYRGPGGQDAALGLLQRFVPNDGDAWQWTLGHVTALLEFVARHPDFAAREPDRRGQLVREFSAGHLGGLRRLGQLTGGLHAALASGGADPAFRPEPITEADVERWGRAVAAQADVALADLAAGLDGLPPPLRDAARGLLDGRDRLGARVTGLRLLGEQGCVKTRIHGDYHLGQALRTGEDFILFDFEGEPARPLAERRARHCPLKDVAGMLRSLDYAAAAALRARPEAAALAPWAAAWVRLAREGFLERYLAEAEAAPARVVPAAAEAVAAALAAFELEKAFYELRYEINNRPEWVALPLGALGSLLGERGEAGR